MKRENLPTSNNPNFLNMNNFLRFCDICNVSITKDN